MIISVIFLHLSCLDVGQHGRNPHWKADRAVFPRRPPCDVTWWQRADKTWITEVTKLSGTWSFASEMAIDLPFIPSYSTSIMCQAWREPWGCSDESVNHTLSLMELRVWEEEAGKKIRLLMIKLPYLEHRPWAWHFAKSFTYIISFDPSHKTLWTYCFSSYFTNEEIWAQRM